MTTVLFFKMMMLSCWVSAATPISTSLEQQENCDNCAEIGEWSLALSAGIGIRTNPLLNGKDIPLILLPEISYYGENFFIENLEIGYTLVDTPKHMINIVAVPSYDRVFFSRWDLGNIFVDISSFAAFEVEPLSIPEDNLTQINDDELTPRKFSVLGGLEYSRQFNHSSLQLSLVTDLTNTHSGTEARFAFSQQVQENISTTVGFTWKDAKLTDYYYGINDNEVIDNRGAYSANSSISPFIRFSWLINSHNKNAWRLSIDYQKLDKEISHSPLVDEDYSVTFFVGKRFKLN